MLLRFLHVAAWIRQPLCIYGWIIFHYYYFSWRALLVPSKILELHLVVYLRSDRTLRGLNGTPGQVHPSGEQGFWDEQGDVPENCGKRWSLLTSFLSPFSVVPWPLHISPKEALPEQFPRDAELRGLLGISIFGSGKCSFMDPNTLIFLFSKYICFFSDRVNDRDSLCSEVSSCHVIHRDTPKPWVSLALCGVEHSELWWGSLCTLSVLEESKFVWRMTSNSLFLLILPVGVELLQDLNS